MTTQDIPATITVSHYSDNRTHEIWSETGIMPPLEIRDYIEYLHRSLMENEEMILREIQQMPPKSIAVNPDCITIASRENLMQFSRNCGIPTYGVSDTELAILIIQILINDYSQGIIVEIIPENHRHGIRSLESHSGCAEY